MVGWLHVDYYRLLTLYRWFGDTPILDVWWCSTQCIEMGPLTYYEFWFFRLSDAAMISAQKEGPSDMISRKAGPSNMGIDGMGHNQPKNGRAPMEWFLSALPIAWCLGRTEDLMSENSCLSHSIVGWSWWAHFSWKHTVAGCSCSNTLIGGWKFVICFIYHPPYIRSAGWLITEIVRLPVQCSDWHVCQKTPQGTCLNSKLNQCRSPRKKSDHLNLIFFVASRVVFHSCDLPNSPDSQSEEFAHRNRAAGNEMSRQQCMSFRLWFFGGYKHY